MHLGEAECLTGFERGHHGKAALNRRFGRAIKEEMRATNDPACSVDAPPGEFIESYQPFLPG